MTATVVGPGGEIEVNNDTGTALRVIGAEVDAPSPSGVALAVVDAEVRLILADVLVALLAGSGPISGTVALDAGTLAALENITVTVASGVLDLSPATLAALETINAVVSGTVALDALTLAALENVVVSGTVAVSNFPASVEVNNDTGNPLPVIVGNFPASVEVANDAGNPLPVSGPLTDVQLRAAPVPVSFAPDESGLTDAQLRASPVPVSGTVSVNEPVTVDGFPTDFPDAAADAALGSILTELGQKLEPGQSIELGAATLAALETITVLIAAGQEVALSAATLAALETIHAIIDSGTVELGASSLAALESITAAVTGTVAVSGSVEVSNDVGSPLSVSATDLDIRDLSSSVDSVRSIDAAEDAALVWATIDFNTAGAHTIVAVTPGQRLRLRRFLPTAGDPDADPPANPVLTLSLGGQSLRSTILIGRFDITGSDGEDLVITASKAGQVDGCVGYVLV